MHPSGELPFAPQDQSPGDHDDASSVPAHQSPSSPPSPALPRRGPLRTHWRWIAAAFLLATAVTTGAILASSDDIDPGNIGAQSTTTPAASGAPAAAPPTTAAVTATPEVEARTQVLDASAVGDATIPSIVTVEVREQGANGNSIALGSGSGVVYDDRGHIITNNHVVAAGPEFEVVLADGRVYPAELLGTDSTTDLAVLSVTARDLVPIGIGTTDELTVGDPAVAVGSPLGLNGGPSLTVGVVSAFGREVRTDSTTALYGMLQTDAPITQGSSGGALVDGSGRLVGITTAVGVSNVGIEGIGFATPVEIVTRVADEIIATGAASNPYIGITGETAYVDTTDGGSVPTGVRVATIERGTAASASQLSEDDVIAAINGDPIKTMQELVALLRRYGAQTTIEVTLDGGAAIDVVLGQRPDSLAS